jgi:tetratricopeptide (TPR) repeat protein
LSYIQVGDVLRDRTDWDGALVAYQESLAINQSLAKADRSNAVWQHDLSVSLTRMSQVHEQQGGRDEALRFAEESLQIDERLALLDPTNVEWQDDVRASRALVARLKG